MAARELVEAEMAPYGALTWSAKRPLTWPDFQGPPPAGSDEAAHTAYSLFSAARCVGSRFDFHVVAAILPRQSWVAARVLGDGELRQATLRHEQTHFDLTETYARRTRKVFAELYEPCLKTEAELDALAQRYVENESVMQRRYDEETRNGRLARKQAEWDAEVARQLASLGRYAIPDTVRKGIHAGFGLAGRTVRP